MIIINRDDASGYRLDTLTTHCKHASPAVQDKDVLTTHTDYVNRHPSILQTTSYNFTGTKTTKEKCAGVVKAAKVFPKNPAQHFADLKMLNNLNFPPFSIPILVHQNKLNVSVWMGQLMRCHPMKK